MIQMIRIRSYLYIMHFKTKFKCLNITTTIDKAPELENMPE